MVETNLKPRLVPCRGCGQMIFFALSPRGSRIPLDASSLVYETAGSAPDGTPMVRIRSHAWVSHFRTCKKVEQFSKPPSSITEGPCPPSTSTQAS